MCARHRAEDYQAPARCYIPHGAGLWLQGELQREDAPQPGKHLAGDGSRGPSARVRCSRCLPPWRPRGLQPARGVISQGPGRGSQPGAEPPTSGGEPAARGAAGGAPATCARFGATEPGSAVPAPPQARPTRVRDAGPGPGGVPAGPGAAGGVGRGGARAAPA